MSSDDERHTRVSATWKGLPVAWRPGYALPERFTATLEGEWLPYTVELDLEPAGSDVNCLAVHLTARAGAAVSPRGIREVPLGECIRLATSAAVMSVTATADGGVRIEPMSDAGSMDVATRESGRRVSDDVLREVAEIYRAAEEKPTRAVQAGHSAAPISYSTAARWVMQARRRGFLPPHKSEVER